MPPGDDTYVYVGSGVLVWRFVLYLTLADDGAHPERRAAVVSRPDEQRLADIVDAAAELSSIVERGRDAFLADAILRRAAERLLEIIGEAANVLSDETTGRFPEIGWRDLARLRIVLAHRYLRVESRTGLDDRDRGRSDPRNAPVGGAMNVTVRRQRP